MFVARTGLARGAIGQDGFTLVEMLVVITIIGLIMGLVGPRVLNYLSESKVKAAKNPDRRASRARSTCTISTSAAIRRPRKGWRRWYAQPPGVAAWNGPYLQGRRGAQRSLGPRLSSIASPGEHVSL